jgi:hypothetical protein
MYLRFEPKWKEYNERAEGIGEPIGLRFTRLVAGDHVIRFKWSDDAPDGKPHIYIPQAAIDDGTVKIMPTIKSDNGELPMPTESGDE